MRYLFLMLLLLATSALFAQGMQPAMQGANEGSTVMLSTAKGLFVLRSGVLAKYDPATLKPEGNPMQLFGPMPARPADMNDRTAMQAYFSEVQKRNAPAIMLPKDKDLLLVIGDNFARIDQETLKVQAAKTFSEASSAAADPAQGFRMMEPAPGYTLVNNTLYLMRSKEILSISITDGKVLARAALPKELQPAQADFRGRGNGNRGGGGNFGGRNGGGPDNGNQ